MEKKLPGADGHWVWWSRPSWINGLKVLGPRGKFRPGKSGSNGGENPIHRDKETRHSDEGRGLPAFRPLKSIWTGIFRTNHDKRGGDGMLPRDN